MKFKKLDIKVRGESIYIDFESKMPASIEQDIKDALKLLDEKRAKDSVPNQFKPDYSKNYNDIFKQFFGK